MNIILLGSGGREHAIAQKIASSPLCDQLFILPGNPGTATYGNNVNINVGDFESIKNFAEENKVSILVVGPEQPLVEGITDYLQKELPEVFVVGPSAYGAKLEGSKAFAKEFMQRHQIPTASYFECNATNLQEGINYLKGMEAPYVLKADGLAAGKGVLILDDEEQAVDELRLMLSGKFGDASTVVVIEQFLSGIEFSVFILTDGADYILLPEAKDYKRIGEGDTGLNTGGMGAVSPVPFADEVLMTKVKKKIIDPTVKGLYNEKIDYKGFVFFGLINVAGEPFVIEYNCRMGDPETEVVMPRFESDIVEAFEALRSNSLHLYYTEVSSLAAATMILVSGGYPEKYEKGKVISGLDNVKNGFVFHSGTDMKDGQLVTNGGRVLAVTSMADTMDEAIQNCRENAAKIEFEGMYFRKDIGFDLE